MPFDENDAKNEEIKKAMPPEGPTETAAGEEKTGPETAKREPAVGMDVLWNIVGFALVFFLAWIGLVIGVIIYFAVRKKKPEKAKGLLVGMVAGFAVRLVIELMTTLAMRSAAR